MTHLSMRNCASLTLIGWLLACSGDEQVQKERERWEASQPRRYVVQTCTLGFDPPACARAAVEDGEALVAEERIFAAGISWEPFEVPRDPLDDMFDRVRQGDTDECELDEVAYDDSLGFVDWYELNCDGSTQGQWVACFEPDTLDLDACDVVPVM